jgi:hypothetical protein
MSPGTIVIADICFQDTPQATIAKDNDVIEAVPSDGADQPQDVDLMPQDEIFDLKSESGSEARQGRRKE